MVAMVIVVMVITMVMLALVVMMVMVVMVVIVIMRVMVVMAIMVVSVMVTFVGQLEQFLRGLPFHVQSILLFRGSCTTFIFEPTEEKGCDKRNQRKKSIYK